MQLANTPQLQILSNYLVFTVISFVNQTTAQMKQTTHLCIGFLLQTEELKTR